MSREAQSRSLPERIVALLLREGPWPFVIYSRTYFRTKVFSKIISKWRRQFIFNDHRYYYFYHPSNLTWTNERAVELPILWEEVEKHDPDQVLEVGNVLSHYHPITHDIVDKHEKGQGVTNLDILDFNPAKRYDLIVSISTIEHIGFTEDESVGEKTLPQPEKPLHAIQHLKGLLAQRGRLIVTIPLGYNLALDQLLRDGGEDVFTCKAYLKRVSKSNKWLQVEKSEVENAKYGVPYQNSANALAIYTYDKTTRIK